MENSWFPIVAGLLAGLDSVAGIIQAVSMVVCLASLLGAVFQGFHERSVSLPRSGNHLPRSPAQAAKGTAAVRGATFPLEYQEYHPV